MTVTENVNPEANPLIFGSSYWWLGIAILIVVGIFFFVFAPKQEDKSFQAWLPVLGWVIFIHQALYWLMAILEQRFTLSASLPLHLCGMSQLLLFAYLSLKQKWAFPLVAFWGPLGGIMGILTPALFVINTFFVVQFFVSHALIVIVPLYLMMRGGKRIPANYFWRVIIFTNILALSMIVVNYFLSANYMYVSQPPPVPPYTSGHWFFQWPWYLIFIEFQLIILVWIYWRAISKFRQAPSVDN